MNLRGRSEQLVVDPEGPGAPPRQNGELVFEEPWQARAFGLALAMHDRGAYDWHEFQRRLIDAIARWDDDDYYVAWLEALERLLIERGALSADELEAETELISERAHSESEHAH